MATKAASKTKKKRGPRPVSESVSVELVEKRTYKDSCNGRYMEDLNQIAENAQALAVDVQENEDWLVSLDEISTDYRSDSDSPSRLYPRDRAEVKRSYRIIAQAFEDITLIGKKAGWLVS